MSPDASPRTGTEEVQSRARWIGAAALVAARIGCIDECRVGEIEFGRPAGHETARPFLPFLIDDAEYGIATAQQKDLAGNIPEPLAVIRPPQARRQLHVGAT